MMARRYRFPADTSIQRAQQAIAVLVLLLAGVAGCFVAEVAR